MNKILKRLKKQAEDSLSNIINMFSIKENCLNFLEEHKQDNELYYKNGNGIQIFKSSDYGNGSFVTINITSFKGSKLNYSFEDNYGFVVSLWINNREESGDIFSNIEDAIEEYNSDLEVLNNLEN